MLECSRKQVNERAGAEIPLGADGTLRQEGDAVPQRGALRGECGGWEGDVVRAELNVRLCLRMNELLDANRIFGEGDHLRHAKFARCVTRRTRGVPSCAVRLEFQGRTLGYSEHTSRPEVLQCFRFIVETRNNI